MPYAGATVETIRYDLKTVEGGWVELKRMTYGQKLARQGEMKLGIELGKGKDIKGELAMADRKSTYDEYKNCIVAHNLEKDHEGTLFNFASPLDIDFLDPRVGEEISKLLSDLNNFEDSDEAKN